MSPPICEHRPTSLLPPQTNPPTARDPAVDASYGQEEECLVKGRGELGGTYIVRLPCGPTHQVCGHWGRVGAPRQPRAVPRHRRRCSATHAPLDCLCACSMLLMLNNRLLLLTTAALSSPQYVRKELLWPYVREFADRGEHTLWLLKNLHLLQASRCMHVLADGSLGPSSIPFPLLNPSAPSSFRPSLARHPARQRHVGRHGRGGPTLRALRRAR